MNVLVINAGSSSLKYQLLEVESRNVLAKGICERIGTPESFHKHHDVVDEVPLNDHNDAMKVVLEVLTTGENAAVKSLDEIQAVGHRIVQGGKYFDKSCIVDDEVVAKIDELAKLAPLHNKAAIMGIEACKNNMPGTPMVTVFDTSFFHNLPKYAHMFPISADLAEKHSIRKYGAHGTSHRYLTQRAAELLGKDVNDVNLITCHLGNGASISAIKGGKAVDTSMGLTPLDGVMMGTRCGGIDPAIVTFLMEQENIKPEDMSNYLNKECGLLGISKLSNDMRTINEAAADGNEDAKLALEMYYYILRRYISMYYGVLNGEVDAIIISAGIGENDNNCRREMFNGIENLGFKLDQAKNDERSGEDREISTPDSPIKIMVIPTEEEYMIAKDTYELVK